MSNLLGRDRLILRWFAARKAFSIIDDGGNELGGVREEHRGANSISIYESAGGMVVEMTHLGFRKGWAVADGGGNPVGKIFETVGWRSRPVIKDPQDHILGSIEAERDFQGEARWAVRQPSGGEVARITREKSKRKRLKDWFRLPTWWYALELDPAASRPMRLLVLAGTTYLATKLQSEVEDARQLLGDLRWSAP